MKIVRFVAMLLLVVGGLNWGLVGFFQYDLVADLFGGMFSQGARIIYALVGLSGLYGLKWLLGCCGNGCGGSGGGCGCGGKCSCHNTGCSSGNSGHGGCSK